MVKHLVVTQVLFELRQAGVGVDVNGLDAGDGGEVFEHFGGDRVAVTGVVGAPGIDPCGTGGLEVGLTFPHGAGDREVGHRGNLDGSYLVNQEAETVAEVDEGGVEGLASRGVEDEANRVLLATDTERVDFDFGFSRGDSRADFEHVRTEDLVALGRHVIGIIFHEGGAARETFAHHFHGANKRGGLPVTFAAEAVARCH